MTTTSKERDTRDYELSSGVKTTLAIAGAATALAAAAAGYYFYASKDAKRNRKIAAQWATDLKKDVIRQMERLNTIDRNAIMTAVDRAAALYKSARDVDMLQLAAAANELKTHWQELASEYRRSRKKHTASSGRSSKKSTRKKSTSTQKTKKKKST